jgi:hypothetical protein
MDGSFQNAVNLGRPYGALEVAGHDAPVQLPRLPGTIQEIPEKIRFCQWRQMTLITENASTPTREGLPSWEAWLSMVREMS